MPTNRNRILLIVGLIGAAVGALGVLAVEQIDHYTSTEAFCGSSCHSMKAYVSNDPTYLESAHRTAWTGVHAGCADCHIPEGLLPATWAHIKGGARDTFAELTNDFQVPENWESRRAELAYRVRDWMVETDSATCRSCHTHEEAIDPGFRRGQREHRRARNEGVTCIVCHYNLVHEPVPPREPLLKLAEGDGKG